MINEDYSPLFEFTSKENKIVIKYEDDSLTLLSIRY
jgi:hypothetical protein